MHFRSMAILVLTSMGLAQALPATAPANPGKAPRKATGLRPSGAVPVPISGHVGADDPVITIQGICDAPAASKTAKPRPNSTSASHKAADCKTVITRSQFERLAAALQPDMTPSFKKKLAELYPTMIIMAHTAEKRGYQSKPNFKELMEFSRIQILSTELNRAVEKDAQEVTPSDIEKYYKDNPDSFEQVTVDRIFIPKGRRKQAPNEKSSAETAEESAESGNNTMKNEADALETRAAAGEDFDKLQKEAFELAGLTPPPSSTNVKLTLKELPADERAILDMQPGEISHVFPESNGYFIYKFLSKERKPLDDKTQEDLKSKLSQQRFQQTMDQLHKSFSATLNEAYFAPEAQARPQRPMPVPRPVPQAGTGPATTSAVAVRRPALVPVTTPAAPNTEVPGSDNHNPGAPPAEPQR